MRRPLIIGNWKMFTTPAEAAALAGDVLPRLAGIPGIEIAIAPPFTSLPAVAPLLAGQTVHLAAQDLHWEDRGAFTGAISHGMLEALGCRFVLVGHSERRTYFMESDEMIARKVQAALRGGLRPVLCVGEMESEREAGMLRNVLRRQIARGLEGVAPGLAGRLAVAYEPVWAIGTGRAATVADAEEAHQVVRRQLERLFGVEPARGIRILYGGSVSPANAGAFAASEAVDGVLVGGASLKPADFAAIARAGWEAGRPSA